MKDRLANCCLLTLVLASACETSDPVVPDASPHATPATAPTGERRVGLVGVSHEIAGPETLWADFQSLHAEARPANTIEIGKQIDVLLSDEARSLFTNALSDSLRAVQHLPSAARIAADTLRHRMLGESAVARRSRMMRYTLGPVRATNKDHAILPIYDGAKLVLEFPIAREHGAWRFLASANLLATYDELYPLPDDRTRVTSRAFTTVEDAADGLVNTLNVGTSWDLLDLLDSTNKAELTEMVKRMGLRDEDLIRSLDSTLRSIRARSGRARVQSITMSSPERASITIAFANGDIDDVAAVNEDGYWLIQMPR